MNLNWLLFALILKSISLSIHEYRLWLGFPSPRPPIKTTLQIGFSSALINILIPGRAGDVAAIALLHKRCGIPVGIATYAVGIVGFFEGAAFGVMMIFVLFWQGRTWVEYLGSDLHQQSIGTITGLTLLGICLVLVASVIGRRVFPEASDEPSGFSPKGWLKDVFNQTGTTLTNTRYVLLNTITSIIEVWLMVAAFALGFWIIELNSNMMEISWTMAWSLSGLVLGISAIAGIVLPPTYGAGSAAASIFILGLFGFNQTEALGFASIWWLISQVPAVALGLPSIWIVQQNSKEP